MTPPTPEEPKNSQTDAIWQSMTKLQQAMRVYRGLDEAEVMQDVQ